MFHCSIPQRRHWFDDEIEVLTATNVVPERRPLMVQKLKSCGLAVVITEDAAELLASSYRSRYVADRLVRCDDPIVETLMISFKVG